MPKYLIEGSYTTEGAKGVQSAGGSARVEAITRAVEGLGGGLESIYFAFGETDIYLIVELPDNTSAIALALAVGTTGAAGLTTTPLVTPEEMDAAAKMSVGYTPPGG